MPKKISATNLLEWCLYGITILVPTIFLPQFQTVFSAPKLLVLQLITLVILLTWGYRIFTTGEIIYCQSRWNRFLGVQAVVFLITTLFSVNIFTSLMGTQDRFLGLFTMLHFLLVSYAAQAVFSSPAKCAKWLFTGFIVASLVAVYGIMQHFGVLQDSFNWTQNPAERVFGTVGHGTHFGTYLGMYALVGFWLFKTLKSARKKVFLVAGLMAQMAGILLSGSRGALLAVAVAILISGVWLCMARQKSRMVQTKKRHATSRSASKTWRTWLLAGLVLVTLVGMALTAFPGGALPKLAIVERTVQLMGATENGQLPDRISWWMSSLAMATHRPLLGYGLSTFADVYNQYRRTDYVTLEPGDMQDTITPEAAHNEYLNILATQGVVGLMVFVGLLVWLFRQSAKALKNANAVPQNAGTTRHSEIQNAAEKKYILLALLGAVLVYLTSALTSFGVITTLTIFWLFLGVLAGMAGNVRPQTVQLGKAKKYIVSGFLLLVMALGFTGAVRSAGAEIFYKSALIAAQQGNTLSSLDHFESATQMNPWEYRYQQAYGDYLLKIGGALKDDTTTSDAADNSFSSRLFRQAVSAYQSALSINNLHPSTWYNLGVTYLQLYALTGDSWYFEESLRTFEESLKKAVNNPLYPYQMGKSLMIFGTLQARQSALTMLQKAQQIRPNYRDTETRIAQLEALLTQPTPGVE